MTTVVFADDQELVRSGFRLILELAGLEVAGEAGDGREAVELARSTRPDVVLTDVRMPGMDGIEATRRIAQAGLPSRVLILTTFDLDEYVYEALRAGASGFLLKDAGRERPLERRDRGGAGDLAGDGQDPTSATCCRSSACETASRPWRSPMRRGCSSDQARSNGLPQRSSISSSVRGCAIRSHP